MFWYADNSYKTNTKSNHSRPRISKWHFSTAFSNDRLFRNPSYRSNTTFKVFFEIMFIFSWSPMGSINVALLDLLFSKQTEIHWNVYNRLSLKLVNHVLKFKFLFLRSQTFSDLISQNWCTNKFNVILFEVNSTQEINETLCKAKIVLRILA